MLINTIKAEWIKLRSTKSIYWTTLLVVILSLILSLFFGWANGFAIQQSLDDGNAEQFAALSDSLHFSVGLLGFQSFGIMVIMIQAVLLVTSDYGNGVVRWSILAAPMRYQIAIAKLVVYGTISIIITIITAIASVYSTRAMVLGQFDDKSIVENLSMSADGAWRLLILTVIFSFFTVALCIGIGFIFRKTAAAMAIVLMWTLVFENLTSLIPENVAKYISPFLPFNNISSALSEQDLVNAPWGQDGSVLYFVAVSVIVFVGGLIVLRRADS